MIEKTSFQNVLILDGLVISHNLCFFLIVVSKVSKEKLIPKDKIIDCSYIDDSRIYIRRQSSRAVTKISKVSRRFCFPIFPVSFDNNFSFIISVFFDCCFKGKQRKVYSEGQITEGCFNTP